MKFIIFNVDLRLNRHDKHAVISKTAIPYSEENMEYAKKHCASGEPAIEEWQTDRMIET